MKTFLGRSLVNFVAILIVSALVDFVHAESYSVLIVSALVLALLNSILRPILMIITLPFNIFTLGFFTLIINTLILMLASNLVNGFSTGGFVHSFVAAIFISLLTMMINYIFKDTSQDSNKENKIG